MYPYDFAPSEQSINIQYNTGEVHHGAKYGGRYQHLKQRDFNYIQASSRTEFHFRRFRHHLGKHKTHTGSYFYTHW